MADFEYKVEKHFGVISADKSGWQKELNLVSWSGRKAKLDLRDWAPEHEKMGKGITLSREEAQKLAELLGKVLAEPDNGV